jgi:hypothetical protein
MGGRAEVDATNVTLLTSNNGALDPNDLSYLVPITTATFDDDAMDPTHQSLADAPQVAKLFFDALAAVDESLADSGMGKTYVTATRVTCSGTGPGAGDIEPKPKTATCDVTSSLGEVFHVDGDKALRLVQGFAHVNGVDQAMGGKFDVEANDLSCERRSNEALEESDPFFEIALHDCTMTLPDSETSNVTVTDASPNALALQRAASLAGLTVSSAMGKSGVVSAHVSCTKSSSVAPTCKLAL